MAQAKVSSKYRIVIPCEVRKTLGIRKGQTVSVIAVANIIKIVPCRAISSIECLYPELTFNAIYKETEIPKE